jgi:O-methyltransferase involved in polyketide biosynthesis
VILIGAGFDTRAFRLPGGRWVEVDEPQVIAHKDPRLPAGSAPNPLDRVPIDFATERLADKLAPYRGERSVTVVVEGVTMYLTRPQLEQLLSTLGELFAEHTLICDLFSETFIRRFGSRMRQRLTEIGASFGDLFDDPEPIFQAAGYQRSKVISIVREARRLGAIPIPLWMINTFFRSMANGYRIWEWEHRPAPKR